jgi:uncharacterized protein
MPADAVLVVLTAFAAATLAGVSGFGGAVVLLPALVAVFGARDAVVVLTVAQLVGNGSRAFFNRRDVDRPIVRCFAIGAVPLALAGGAVFATIPAGALTRGLGAFMLGAVAWRHLHRGTPAAFPRDRFIVLGAAFGFLSAIVGSVGPVMAPFFLGYGLVKGAYIGTEAACTIVMHVTKLAAYGGGGVLSDSAILAGLGLAPVMVAGSWLGKRVLDRLPERTFTLIIEAVLIVSGSLLLIQD